VIIPVKNTRIAPTPSGFLHVGNILSFAITSALARENDAKVLLRIDDLDQARADTRYIQDIFDTLNYLEIPWDIGPQNVQEFNNEWSQTNRMRIYHEAIKKLCDKGLVFACTCSRQQIRNSQPCLCLGKQIPFNTENASLRLLTGSQGIEITTLTGQIIIAALPAKMRNFVIRRRDGIPSYQLASVVDDLYYDIDLIVRGEDLWASTIAQHELALALDDKRFSQVRFYHHPLLEESPGKKLSKSSGSTSVKYLRENGKKPADIYTIISEMLGIDQQVGNWEQLTRAISSDLDFGDTLNKT